MASDEEVYTGLARATDPLTESWERLARAKTIAVKFNQDFRTENVRIFEGQRRELVSDSVARALLRLLRERTHAKLLCVDASYGKIYGNASLSETTQLGPLLEEFGVRYVDGTEPPFIEATVPGGGAMFAHYTLPEELVAADAVVSVAKMKNHGFMGVTGCLKNLFGLLPAEPYARPRHYYHHLVRMPYVLTDLGRILDPALCIVDALVGQAGREWNREPDGARIVDTLIAGDQVIATDAVMTHLMGHDPRTDWLTDPFLRDRNALLVAAQNGFGTVDLISMDFQTEVKPQPPGTFRCLAIDVEELIVDWRRSMCEQALWYRDNTDRYHEYDGQYVLLQQGKVRWHSPDGGVPQSRRKLAGPYKNQSLYLKFVDPQEREGEQFAVYEDALEDLGKKGLGETAP
jgi:hypothetical protein